MNVNSHDGEDVEIQKRLEALVANRTERSEEKNGKSEESCNSSVVDRPCHSCRGEITRRNEHI